jgi:hypothetical protein
MIFGLLVILLLAAQFASGKSLDEVIENYIRATGGEDQLAVLQTVFMEGSLLAAGEEQRLTIYAEQDRLLRITYTNDSGTGMLLLTTGDAWSSLPAGSGAGRYIRPEAHHREALDIAGPLVQYVQKGHRAELAGKESVEGHECYKVRLITAAGSSMLFWIDRKSFLLRQSGGAYNPFHGNAFTPTTILYKDHRFVDGLLFPHLLEVLDAQQLPVATVVFEKVSPNLPLSPELYKPGY